MPLVSGTWIGAYEIVSPLGEGGMGEVYRAHDSKLGRDVAVKILPDSFAGDADRLMRFEREAKTLAALNHPNIAQVFGLEDGSGTRAIVMELIEGEDLAAHIERGPIPLDEALAIARQIAAALEAAHDAGIIHRDLKPANIRLRPDGTVKVFDFGLAKALDPAVVQSGVLQTVTSPAMTMGGVILGTVTYMSPEQARGRAVDRRADVWAFGCVLFEMLTGTRAFRGNDTAEVIAQIIQSEPDWTALPASTPPSVRGVLHRCLQKDPARRFHHVADARLDLEGASDRSASLTPTGDRRSLLWIGGALGLAGVAALAGWALKPTPAATQPISRFTLTLTGAAISNLTRPAIAVAPDGSRIAYVANNAVFVRDFDRLEARRIAQGASAIFFSADSQWLGFWGPGRLMKAPASGGGAQVISSEEPFGVHWADSSLVFANDKGIARLSPNGDSNQLITATRPSVFAWPQLLPDGKTILYSDGQGRLWEQADIVAQSLDGRDRRVVLTNASGARYVPTGHLVYGNREQVMAVPFDLPSLRVTGEPVALPLRAQWSNNGGWSQMAWSASGTLAYLEPLNLDLSRLVWVDRQGRQTAIPVPPRQYSDPRLSPDGRSVAAHLLDDQNDVWVSDLSRGTLTRLTFEGSEDETPVWSPDGRHVAYAANRKELTRGIYRRLADGSGPEELMWSGPLHVHVMDWSRDGRTLVLSVQDPKTNTDILLLDLQSGQTRPVIQTAANDRFGRLSPDGRFIVYSSDESGREEIFVQPFPSLDARIQASNDGGTQPIWSRDGRELFYRTARNVMGVAVTPGNPIALSGPVTIFTDRFARPQAGDHLSFDVAPDGRFLMIAVPEDQEAVGRGQEIQVVLNWFEELRRLVPR